MVFIIFKSLKVILRSLRWSVVEREKVVLFLLGSGRFICGWCVLILWVGVVSEVLLLKFIVLLFVDRSLMILRLRFLWRSMERCWCRCFWGGVCRMILYFWLRVLFYCVLWRMLGCLILSWWRRRWMIWGWMSICFVYGILLRSFCKVWVKID